MEKDVSHEIGVLHAHVEYLRVVISILLSRLSEDDRVDVGVEVFEHFAKHQADALNSTFPDSYLRECDTYPPAQIADATKRYQRRKYGTDSTTS